MFLIVYIINLYNNLILALSKHKTKLISLTSTIILAIVLRGNERVADYISYENAYSFNQVIRNDLSSSGVIESGYKALELVFLKLGLDYSQFRTVLVIVSMIIIYGIVEKHAENPHVIYFIYSIFLVFMDAIQIRFFFASVLVAIAFDIYISNKKWTRWISVIILTMAVLLHSAMIMYLLSYCMLQILKIFKKYYKMIILVAVIVGIFVVQNINFTRWSSIIGQFTLRRYVYSRTSYGFLFAWIVQAIQLVRVISIKKIAVYENEEDNYLFASLEKLTYGGLVYLPLYIINLNFYRYLRGTFFIFLLFGVGNVQRTCGRRKWIPYCLVLLECVAWISYEVIFDNFNTAILIPTFM